MCLICVQFELGKLTRQEVYRAVGEMVQTSKEFPIPHVKEILELVDKISETDKDKDKG